MLVDADGRRPGRDQHTRPGHPLRGAPVPVRSAGARALVHVEHSISGYQGPRRRVLLVDDHLDHRRVLAGMLEPLGFELAEAANGQDAIRQVALWQPDLILMDLSMPLLDGLETSALIRRTACPGRRSSSFPPMPSPSIANAAPRPPATITWPNRSIRAAAGKDQDAPGPDLAWSGPPNRLQAIGVAPITERCQSESVTGAGCAGLCERHPRLPGSIEREEPASAVYVDTLRALVKRFQLNDFNRRVKDALQPADLPLEGENP